MADFGDIDDFNDCAVQGKPIKAYRNGNFDASKALFVQHNWTWDEFLFSASQRLEMVPAASRVFNADGVEIDDVMCIEENDMLFFSTGASFQTPSSNDEDDSTQTDEKSGANVIGGYKVTKLLGRGGFGEVRLGVHQLTNEQVALKFILKSEMGSLVDVERTTTEIQCLTALNHPSIIKLLRVINEANHLVLVFELLEGGDLFHHLKSFSGKGVPEDEGAALFTQILAGVGYAHNQHICHRDLKLENILLANKDDISVVKIADFGLSDFYKPGATMKTSCGSLSYLAPEVFRGTCNAGPPLDVWSLGVILFAIVCGRLPFEGSDLVGTNRPRENVIRSRIMRCQCKLDDHLTPALVDLVTQMLQPDPNERATIPEIFGHPWVRGAATGSFAMDFAMPIPNDLGKEEEENIYDGSGKSSSSLQPTTTMPDPGAAPAPATTPLFTPSNSHSNAVGDEDRLPSIVPKSPVPGSTVSTPTTGRIRPSRIMDHPLQPTKQVGSSGSHKSDRPSPRLSLTSTLGAPTTGFHSASGHDKSKNPTTSSPSSGHFKRNMSGHSNVRARPRLSGEKAQMERHATHLADVDRRLEARSKHGTRRSDTHVDESADQHGRSNGKDVEAGRRSHDVSKETN